MEKGARGRGKGQKTSRQSKSRRRGLEERLALSKRQGEGTEGEETCSQERGAGPKGCACLAGPVPPALQWVRAGRGQGAWNGKESERKPRATGTAATCCTLQLPASPAARAPSAHTCQGPSHNVTLGLLQGHQPEPGSWRGQCPGRAAAGSARARALQEEAGRAAQGPAFLCKPRHCCANSRAGSKVTQGAGQEQAWDELQVAELIYLHLQLVRSHLGNG